MLLTIEEFFVLSELLTKHRERAKPESPAKTGALKQAEIFRELALLPNREDRKKLLLHQLSALTNEHLRQPFHAYLLHTHVNRQKAPTLSASSSSVTLFDPLYAEGSVLDRCQRAIAQAQSPDHAKRFALELSQMQQLEAVITEVISQAPAVTHAVLDQLAFPGWVKNTTALSPEQAKQAGVPQDTAVFLGQKYFYLMPQSSIHDGEMSMYLLAQPAYIPATQSWVVLQEQLFEQIPWEEHAKAINRAKTNPHSASEPAKITNYALDSKEQELMSHCIELHPSLQATHPRAVLSFLAGVELEALLNKQQQLTQQHAALKQSLELHAEYLLDIQELDDAWEKNWSNTKVARLSQALFNTLSSIYHHQPITTAQTTSWLAEYQALYSVAKNRSNASDLADTLRLASSQNASWLTQGIASKLECFSMSATKLTLQQAAGLNPQGLMGFSDKLLLSPQEQALLQETLAEFTPLKFANGETWYIPKKYLAEYAAGCTVEAGQVLGPCGIPLSQDNLVLSEEQYQALQQQFLVSQEQTLATHSNQAKARLLEGSNLTAAEQQEALELLTLVEEQVLVSSLGLHQFIAGEVISFGRLAKIPQLITYYQRLFLSANPLEELRDIVANLLQHQVLQREHLVFSAH